MWVEGYKNIQKQGFNFSSRFECSYDEDTKELTINEKEHLENFFGKDINVTAIVGENGSGKSGVLYFLDEILFQNPSKKYILIINIDNKNFHLTNIDNISLNLPSFDKKNLNTYFYSNEEININNKISLKKQDILKLLSSTYSDKFTFKLSSFMYIPIFIKIIKHNIDEIFDQILGVNSSEYDYTYDENSNFQENRNMMYGEEDNKNSLSEITDQYHRFLLVEYMSNIGYDNDDFYILENINDLMKHLSINDIAILTEKQFNKYFIIQNKQFTIKNLSKQEEDIYINRYINYFDFDFIDEKKRRYNNLSHGERTLFGQLLNIYDSMQKKDNLLFLFDEPELSLHPQWQKNI